MPALTGGLTSPRQANWTGYRVTAAYTVNADDAPVPSSSGETTGADGSFTLTLPDAYQGPIDVRATAPSGVEVGMATVAKDAPLPDRLAIAATPVPPVVAAPSTDPARGRLVRLTGRVLDPDGYGVPQGLMVLLWGRPGAGPPVPVAATQTTDGGYFADDWPTGIYSSGFGTVGPSDPIPVPLDADGRFPHVVMLVTQVPPPAPSSAGPADDSGCSCDAVTPPRAPGQAELTSNGVTFSADLGGGQCVNLTVPNRTVEELRFHAVVRTTEPQIKGVTLPDPVGLPAPLVDRLTVLASISPGTAAPLMLSAGPGSARLPAAGGDPPAAPGALHLDAAVVADQLRTGLGASAPTGELLLRADTLSRLKFIGDVVKAIGWTAPGRVTPDADHRGQWDGHPVTYQATTVAIGHLLTMKQVWRADGYSLGDLLYSLPLAPGQIKQIASLDWDRRESAVRQAARAETEQLAASLSHDRDISEIIYASLAEHDRGSSSASVSAIGGGIGGFIGPIVFGGGGGGSDASSEAHAHNTRDVASSMLNQAQDRTSQAANSVRSQRVTVVQSARQGESLTVQTEAVSNHNHCHAVTMEYFEVLRHFQVSVELADVQECLFVPLSLDAFTPAKALRWRDSLAPALSRRDLVGGFDALAQVLSGWADADVPAARFADEPVTELDGELRVTLDLPRPADAADGTFDAGRWGLWVPFLPDTPQAFWNASLGLMPPDQRDAVWAGRLAPPIAARIVATLGLSLELDGGSTTETVAIEPTLVSTWAPDQWLLVSLQPPLAGPNVVRSRITGITLSLGATLPLGVKMVARAASLHYRTDHLSHDLAEDSRVDEELGGGLQVHIPVRLDRAETRNPRQEDSTLATALVAHLNERVEYYHQAIWRAMDANRRYLLLDGFLAPNAGGRSVASVVENRLIGIVGNCLVLPVVPGTHLDPQWTSSAKERATLFDLYTVDPPPPRRISVPTKGVYAEAVMGACDSCEKKDDSRFWRWEESPNPDQPTAIQAISTASRRTAPADTGADVFPAPIAGYQQAPASPDPTGLAAALNLIGTPNLFRDLTGLDLNQQAAATAFSSALDTAQFFGTQAAGLAQQRFQNQEIDRNLNRIQTARDQGLITASQARSLTQSALHASAGGAAADPPPSSNAAVRRAIDRAANSPSGSVTVSRPSGTVSVTTGDRSASGPLSFEVSPAPAAIAQPSPNTCWAAAGAILLSWLHRTSLTVTAAADQLGGGWRSMLDADHPLSVAEVVSYSGALGLVAEPPMDYLPRGILRLLQQHGPLLVIGDNAIDGDHLVHARIVTGLRGDGTSDGTTVRYLDPADGGTHDETFTEFLSQIDTSDAVATGLGIMHF